MADFGVGEYAMIAAMVASTAVSVYSTMNAPKPPGAPAEVSDTRAEEAAYAQAQALRKRQGGASTILTGPMGVTSPGTTLKTQLGA